MVTQLLLSLRKASDPATVKQWGVDHSTRPRTFGTITTTEDRYTFSDILNFAAVHLPQFEILDSVVELSGLGQQDEGHLGASDNASRDVVAVWNMIKIPGV